MQKIRLLCLVTFEVIIHLIKECTYHNVTWLPIRYKLILCPIIKVYFYGGKLFIIL